MKIVQKVLSHGLLIAFFVAVFFIYMNRVKLFPQWFTKSAPVTAEHSQVKEENPVASQVPQPDTVALEPGAVSEMPAAAPGDNQAQAGAELVQPAAEPQIPATSEGSEPVFRPIPETQPVEVAEPVGGSEAGLQQADAVSAPLEVAVAATEEETVASTEQVVTGHAAADQDTAAASDFQERLELARAHFWQQDMPAALQVYQSLAESYPERAEVWGELGNLYFNIRRTSDAMDAYGHAAELLVEQGDAEGTRELLNVMYRLDARRASQFEMRLTQTGGGGAADGR